MKKPVLFLTSALLLSLALTACGGEPAPAESTVPSDAPAESAAPAASAATEVSAVPEAAGELLYTPGSYAGVGEGYNGPITVTVVVAADRIESIMVNDHSDSEGIIQKANDNIAPAIIAANSTDVEPITGATLTSDGYKEAVRNALAAARG